MNNKNLLQTVKFAIIFAAIVISYLFALNGRYSYCDDFVFLTNGQKELLYYLMRQDNYKNQQ